MPNSTPTRLTWEDLETPGDSLTHAEARRAGRIRRLIEGAAGCPLAELLDISINPAADAPKETIFALEFLAHRLLTTASIGARREADEWRFFQHQRLMDDARGLAEADAEESQPAWID